MKKSFLAQLAIRKSKGIKRKSKMPPKWLYPTGVGVQYHRILRNLTLNLKKLIKENLLPQLPGLLNEVEIKMPNDRQDDFLSAFNSIILFIRRAIEPLTEETVVESEGIGLLINQFNQNQFSKLKESAFGIDIFTDEPWLLDQLKLFSSQNAQLIRSLPQSELERVAGIVERGLQEGKTYKDVAKEIQNSFGISDRRAKLIARDQTKKLNSSLTKLRQQELGVEEYIWQTSGDERVRPTHRANDGKIFRWDRPPAITGHPGNDINCRCVARPVLDKLLGL